MDKIQIHKSVAAEVKRRFEQLQDLLKDAYDSTTNESKSSAGDKHETSRAMAQLEQEKIGGQLSEMSKLSVILNRIDPTIVHSKIQLGSLIQTESGWFYLSVGIGAIQIANNTIFCMTIAAPLGKMLMGKKIGDEFIWQDKKIVILEVW